MKLLPYRVASHLPVKSMLARWVAFPLLGLSAALTLVQPCASAPFQFEPTGSLRVARQQHTATLLSNGRVLVAGGSGATGIFSSAEQYDSANGTWTSAGHLANARFYHTATLLADGKVLVAGGYAFSLA